MDKFTEQEAIHGSRIRQVRELNRITQTQIADAAGVNQSTIARIEAGEMPFPPPDLLAAIAEQTGVTVGFFNKKPLEPISEGSLVYRARAKPAVGVQRQALQYAALLLEQTQTISRQLRLPKLHLPAGEDPSHLAQATRDILKIRPDTPVPHLINRLERNGTLVFALPIKLEKIDAFSAWAEIDGPRPFLGLSKDCPGDRTRYSISHELGHLVMHKGLDGRTQNLEDEANDFAAEFLLPEHAMRQTLSRDLTLSQTIQLKKRWKVSIQAIVRRARGLNIISDRRYRDLFTQISSRGWRKTEPAEITLERPRAFRKMAEMLYGPHCNIGLAEASGISVSLATTLLSLYDTSYIDRGLPETQPYNIVDWEHLN